jgi:N-formylglutamate amidohydrolase
LQITQFSRKSRNLITDYKQAPFELSQPGKPAGPFVFNSPHSGRHYIERFTSLSALDASELRQSEDFVVDELFSSVTALGAPLLAANFPRAWLDVNREPYEFDSTMFSERLPDYVNTRSARVAGGLGTIARIVSEDKPIYAAPLSVADALARIEEVYKPYHAALRGLLAEAVMKNGYGVLIDCHSMPSSSNPGYPGIGRTLRADFVLGDRYGTSCARDLMVFAAEILRDLGYSVTINKPYAGGFITEHYGRPSNGLHAIQVEINRALYMDEVAIHKHDGFSILQRDLNRFVSTLMTLGSDNLFATMPLAAE